MDIRTSVKARASPLPTFSDVHEKHHLTTKPSRFFTTFYMPLPPRWRLVIPLPIPPAAWIWIQTKLGRKKSSFFVWAVLLGILYVVFALSKAVITQVHPPWTKPILGSPPTLVFGREDLRRIWEWEIAAGHYPSSRPIPAEIRMAIKPLNPGIPPAEQQRSSSYTRAPSTIGIGSRRDYIDVRAKPPNTAYPPRPPPGSVADLDFIMDNCDYSENKWVRDCMEVLRLGGGLDNNNHLRRGSVDVWKYIYTEASASTRPQPPEAKPLTVKQRQLIKDGNSNTGLWRKDVLEPRLNLTTPVPSRPMVDLPGPCDPKYPRIFHIFWVGPFTDKPYSAILSFLFTQNVFLHTKTPDPSVCRPEFWVWINPGPAAAVPNPNALRDMFRDLSDNPWASPFLHPRFKDVVKFKMWNTTEQLDGVPEFKDEWRKHLLFNSGGEKYKQKDTAGKKQEALAAQQLASRSEAASAPAHAPKTSANTTSGIENELPGYVKASASGYPTETPSNDLFDRVGSKSEAEYDRLSVILSDLARFVLLHRFGGTYLDADTLLLRDWEELWNWRGAFAYRWSRLPTYNTAILRLNKGSALGTFLLRTIYRNEFDFHPMRVGDYTRESFLEPLLLRLPDALFDPAWLSQEGYQPGRPQFPYFELFSDFFTTPTPQSAAPGALGFDGFFKGAYCYHYHNGWWSPFDKARNFPDLGPKFKDGERKARARGRAEEAAAAITGKAIPPPHARKLRPLSEEDLQALEDEEDDVLLDTRDLSWSAVLKRTFEAYIRGERPNMYGEWLEW